MKILIIGLGSMGHRYIDILQRNYDFNLYALRSGSGLTETPNGVIELTTWTEVMDIKPDVAFITNPTRFHIDIALECAEREINLFIEKPLDVSTKGLDRLINLVKENDLMAYVAYPFRFHEGLYKLRTRQAYMRLRGREFVENAEIVCKTNYKKWQPYKVGEHRREHDGVLLELSHEIDLASWFFGAVTDISGFSGDTMADLMLRCAEADEEIRILLDMDSDDEERYISFDGTRFDYFGNMRMYEHQVKYYIDHCVRPSMMINNLKSASDLFCRLIQFRDSVK